LKGESLAIIDGRVLWCPSEEDYYQNKESLKSACLLDVALGQQTENRVYRGWACMRYLAEAGYVENRAVTGMKRFRDATHAGAGVTVIKGLTAMITWHGPFGVDKIDPDTIVGRSVQGLVLVLQQSQEIVAVWKRVKEGLLASCARFRCVACAAALEICTRTWHEEHRCVLHVHAWIMQGQNKNRLSVQDFQFGVGERTPVLSAFSRAKTRGQSGWAGCFYVAVEKIGQVFSMSSKTAHVDYTVKPSWVTALAAGGKIPMHVAKEHYLLCVVDAQKHIAQLEWADHEKTMLFRAKFKMEMLLKVMRAQKPFRSIPEITRWADKYDPENPKDRYDFLVLGGPSRMGKTRFVQRQLVDHPDEALMLDCADAEIPALKGNYKVGQHKLICFDEAHASMVIRCKKLFQASIDDVTYGSSPTNAFIHTVDVHMVKMVVCSNVWEAEKSKLPQEHQEWLDSNSVYVHVDRPLWVL